MSQEPRRACGYRKVGGLYLCSDGLGAPCCKLPILLTVCPTCNGGIKQSRGWQWVDPRPWIKGQCSESGATLCPASGYGESLGDRVGLIWIGAQFYPTPASFMIEAAGMGVSRRITAVPRGFKLGETWVFLAHPRIKETLTIDPTGETVEWIGGVFQIFRPERIEKIVAQSQAADDAAMAKLAKAGITPVIVPDDDRDHRGSVYDDMGARRRAAIRHAMARPIANIPASTSCCFGLQCATTIGRQRAM
jgi:hypothetical protein